MANSTDLWVGGPNNTPKRVTISSMALAATLTAPGVHLTGAGAAIVGGHVYFGDGGGGYGSGYHEVHKFSISTNAYVSSLNTGDSQGGGSYESVIQMIGDGTSLWVLTNVQSFLNWTTLERIDAAAGKTVHSIFSFDSGLANNGAKMAKVGDALFVRCNHNLHRIATNLG